MDRRGTDRLDRAGILLLALLLLMLLLPACDRFVAVEEKEPPPPTPDPAVVEALEELTEPVRIEMPDPGEPAPFALNKRSQVSILLYHDFSKADSSNPMKINIEKFRQQMQALKDNEIPVISMTDFLKWKRGAANIPDYCAMISIDDGWREVYTMAFPILKEHGFPFTLFLYTKYLNVGGRSLSIDQVKEMMAAGAEVGSHSVSHLDMTNRHRMSDEGYEDFLTRELKESRDVLREKLGTVTDTFSYPFGTYSQKIIDLAKSLGYELMLTVDGKKNSWDTPNPEIGRYIIHGNDDRNYQFALTFRGNTSLAGGNNLLAPAKDKGKDEDETGERKEESLVTTSPAAEETISSRLPLIEVDLSKLEGVVPESIEMMVSGLGLVPAQWNGATGKLTYQLRQRLRDRSCSVQVKLQRLGETEYDVIAWTFFVERVAHYLREDDEADEARGEGEVSRKRNNNDRLPG